MKSVEALIVCLMFYLTSGALADPLAQSTIDCDAFKKTTDGQWTTVRSTTISFGSTTMTLDESNVGPGMYKLDGADLYAIINAKCDKK